MIMYVAQCAALLPFGRRDGDANPVGALVLLMVGPVAASLIQLAITRSREYDADQISARVTGDPLALTGALRKLERATRAQPLPRTPGLRSTAALMIANPFGSQPFGRVFSTHPPTAKRIARLEALAGRRHWI